MRILRLRRGFQADHSSSSYLFYAADHAVSAEGRRVARRFSSRAEVDERAARYVKWGDADLSEKAYTALLGEHYDVMVSESYDWWTLKIALPKTAETRRRLVPFRDARGYDDQGVEVEDYGRRLIVTFYCAFDYEGPVFEGYEDDYLEDLADLLVKIRREIADGNTSFPRAVAEFYEAELEPSEQAAAAQSDEQTPPWLDDSFRKADLQEACRRRGVSFRQSWTKAQLRHALAGAASGGAAPQKLSAAARKIVASLQRY